MQRASLYLPLISGWSSPDKRRFCSYGIIPHSTDSVVTGARGLKCGWELCTFNIRRSLQTASYSFSGFWFGFLLVLFWFFPYSYTIDSMCVGDGEINCGSRWTGRGVGIDAFATFWKLWEKNMGNCGFLESLQFYSCCQAQELAHSMGNRSSPRGETGCMQTFILSISLPISLQQHRLLPHYFKYHWNTTLTI